MPGPRILLLNSSQDVLDALCEILTGEGFSCSTAHVRALRQHERSATELLAERAPDAMLFDISPPMAENWAYFTLFEQLPGAKARPIILTTTNGHALAEVASDRPALEILL